jgi:hypothetical protein
VNNLQTAIEALEPYLLHSHHSNCNVALRYRAFGGEASCTCGLDQALAALRSADRGVVGRQTVIDMIWDWHCNYPKANVSAVELADSIIALQLPAPVPVPGALARLYDSLKDLANYMGSRGMGEYTNVVNAQRLLDEVGDVSRADRKTTPVPVPSVDHPESPPLDLSKLERLTQAKLYRDAESGEWSYDDDEFIIVADLTAMLTARRVAAVKDSLTAQPDFCRIPGRQELVDALYADNTALLTRVETEYCIDVVLKRICAP